MDRKQLKKDITGLLVVLAVTVAIAKIAFHKESFLITTRTAFAWWWMFTLPGYALLSYWNEKLEFMERAVIGTAAAAAVTAIASYYLGLIGLHVKYHGILLPLAMIATGIAVMKARKPKQGASSHAGTS